MILVIYNFFGKNKSIIRWQLLCISLDDHHLIRDFTVNIKIEAVDNKIKHGIDCSNFIVTPIEGQNIYINFNIKVGSNKRTVWSMLYMTWHFGILLYCRRFPQANRRTSRTLMTSPHCTSRFRRRLTHLSRQHTSWTSKSALVIRIQLVDGCLYTANMWSPLKNTNWT